MNSGQLKQSFASQYVKTKGILSNSTVGESSCSQPRSWIHGQKGQKVPKQQYRFHRKIITIIIIYACMNVRGFEEIFLMYYFIIVK